MDILSNISPEQPVLIAGPTASGKSALALEIAVQQGGVIINADAIQVYDNWRILTARPNDVDETTAPHALYGHKSFDSDYSVGQWLRDVAPLMGGPRPIIVGGTGLYFGALTNGLADIPRTPADIRRLSEEIIGREGIAGLLPGIDPETRGRIDTNNPMRVQRAWEVAHATGKSLANWQDATPPPLLPVSTCYPIIFDVEKEWLNTRIEARFDQMLLAGALDEARANLGRWDPTHLSSKAIGSAQLIAYLAGKMTLEDARESATIATRQFAKRQRTWFRSKMRDWVAVTP